MFTLVAAFIDTFRLGKCFPTILNNNYSLPLSSSKWPRLFLYYIQHCRLYLISDLTMKIAILFALATAAVADIINNEVSVQRSTAPTALTIT